MRKKTSKIWTTSKEELENIVKNEVTLSGILRKLGLDPSNSGSRFRALKLRFKQDNIDFSNISVGALVYKNRRIPSRAAPLDKVMIKNSTYHRQTLKKRLIKEKILENKCDICNLKPEWNNIKLVMVLDHINGARDDNRKENLRLLCPNCNSQQDTFAGRANKLPPTKCKKCDTNVYKKSKTGLCYTCYALYYKRKVKNRPSKMGLLKEIKETSYCAVGRKYGVSDTAIRKWLK